ncbi:hypothetical protein ABIE35_000065 [Paenarthrobacter sp. 4246]
MIVQLRLCVPTELSEAVVKCCTDNTGAAEVAVHKNASVVPPGDVIAVQIARESAEELIERLHELKVPDLGSISISSPDLVCPNGLTTLRQPPLENRPTPSFGTRFPGKPARTRN